MNITMIEIPNPKWETFFEDIGNNYYGWAVSVEVMGRHLGDYPISDGLPLQGISFEKAGSMAGDILIDVGEAGFP
ncbi:MAG TPA: DUF5335 family protein, partial [Tepidisphaeraceae bacterium]|nr:DUF5335 family protein [Tepidisphaeraceae bacterium]